MNKSEQIKLFLSKIYFYDCLDSQAKDVFYLRVAEFIQNVEVITSDNKPAHLVQKLLIANVATQITFGLENYSLEPLKRVVIYPHLIENKKTNKFFKGLTFANGVIHLYWDAVLDGFSNQSDGVNLVMHELTHALMITLSKANEPDVRFASYYDKWMQVAMQEEYRLSKSNMPFLRNYAHTNKAEMFAVCVENFFERPEEMSTKLPDTFNHLCFLLNLNPLNRNYNFKLEESFINKVNNNPHLTSLPIELRKNYKYHVWHWSLLFWSIGTPLGWGFFLISLKYIMMPLLLILLVLIPLSGVLFYGLFRKHFLHQEILTKKQYITFIGIVGAPATYSLVALLNYNITIGGTVSTFYSVPDDKIELFDSFDMPRAKAFYVDELLPFESNQFNLPSNINSYTKQIEIRSSRGIFGIKNCEECIVH